MLQARSSSWVRHWLRVSFLWSGLELTTYTIWAATLFLLMYAPGLAQQAAPVERRQEEHRFSPLLCALLAPKTAPDPTSMR